MSHHDDEGRGSEYSCEQCGEQRLITVAPSGCLIPSAALIDGVNPDGSVRYTIPSYRDPATSGIELLDTRAMIAVAGVVPLPGPMTIPAEWDPEGSKWVGVPPSSPKKSERVLPDLIAISGGHRADILSDELIDAALTQSGSFVWIPSEPPFWRRALRWTLRKVAYVLAALLALVLLALAVGALTSRPVGAVTVAEGIVVEGPYEWSIEDPRVGCESPGVDEVWDGWSPLMWECGQPTKPGDPPCVVEPDWAVDYPARAWAALSCVDLDAPEELMQSGAILLTIGDPVPVPEPDIALMLAVGMAVLAGIAAVRRRRRRLVSRPERIVVTVGGPDWGRRRHGVADFPSNPDAPDALRDFRRPAGVDPSQLAPHPEDEPGECPGCAPLRGPKDPAELPPAELAGIDPITRYRLGAALRDAVKTGGETDPGEKSFPGGS